MTIRVMLADDHEMVREGVKALLAQEGMEVVGEAVDGEAALEQARLLHPDVVVMDISMPGGGGVAAPPGRSALNCPRCGWWPFPFTAKGSTSRRCSMRVHRGTS